MTENVGNSPSGQSVFAGLTPTVRRDDAPPPRVVNPTVPIFLVGTMAMTMTVMPQPEQAVAGQTTKDGIAGSARPATVASAVSGASRTALPAPSSYTVVAGDTVSAIAARYGLKTATVLALNGLSARSLIFPGQKLTLTAGVAPAPAATPAAPAAAGTATTTYTIRSGDTVTRIAARYGVSTQAVLSANGLSASSIIYAGKTLVIPGQAAAATAPASTPPAPVTPPPAPAPAPAPAAVNGSYVIQSGDNLTKIAARFGVTLDALLVANGLSRTSIIYAGRSLVIPGVATPATAGSGTITLLTDEQEGNAATIISVGRSLGVSDYGLVIALATAMQESSLRNISYGHLDSVGLFQQRPSAGWGTVAQLTDASHATKLFFGGPSNPNKGKTRGLLDIAGWQSLPLTQAAQKVQISAYPNAYAKWEASARFWLSELG